MARKGESLREQGLKVGLVFGSRCPYRQGNDEARQWALGWSEGMLRRTGGTRGCCGLKERDLWRRLVRRFLGN